MQYTQLDFFPETKEQKLEKDIEKLKADYEKLRKGHFARGNEQKREIDEIRHRLDTLILALCRNEKYHNHFI